MFPARNKTKHLSSVSYITNSSSLSSSSSSSSSSSDSQVNLTKHFENFGTSLLRFTQILQKIYLMYDKVVWTPVKDNDKFTDLESQLLVTKNVNSLLQQRATDLERQCCANAQYARRECLEVAGIPESVKQNELEDKVLRIFKKVGCDTPSDKIEACHRVGRHNHVIIKFSKRKDCKKIGIKSFKISKV